MGAPGTCGGPPRAASLGRLEPTAGEPRGGRLRPWPGLFRLVVQLNGGIQVGTPFRTLPMRSIGILVRGSRRDTQSRPSDSSSMIWICQGRSAAGRHQMSWTPTERTSPGSHGRSCPGGRPPTIASQESLLHPQLVFAEEEDVEVAVVTKRPVDCQFDRVATCDPPRGTLWNSAATALIVVGSHSCGSGSRNAMHRVSQSQPAHMPVARQLPISSSAHSDWHSPTKWTCRTVSVEWLLPTPKILKCSKRSWRRATTCRHAGRATFPLPRTWGGSSICGCASAEDRQPGATSRTSSAGCSTPTSSPHRCRPQAPGVSGRVPGNQPGLHPALVDGLVTKRPRRSCDQPDPTHQRTRDPLSLSALESGGPSPAALS